MNVLMITEKDAANTSLARIADAFIAHGDAVEIYAAYYDERVLGCFADAIPRHRVKEISNESIAWCDIIVCSTLVSIYIPIIVFMAHKPIFTHNYLMNRQINWGGDICFAPSQVTVASDYDEYLNYSYIGIGDPKYDSKTAEGCTNGKRFLFIDSGHFPFSIEGKRELARTLIHICRKCPDHELVIKPRFLPGDKVITHRNAIHLYDVLWEEAGNDMPPNMIMLSYHEDLKKLIDSSAVVICMYTTAFVGAVVSGKGLIILENLKTTDVYDIREKTYMRNRENMLDSGALIDYQEVDKLLPDGVKSNQKYLDFLLEEKENVAGKIVEVCRYLWEKFYSKGRFPHSEDSTYKNYRQRYVEDKDLTWEKVVSRRCHDYTLLKSLILIDFHVKAKLDISYVLESAKSCEDENGLMNDQTFRAFLSNAINIRDNCIIRNKDRLLKDKIDAGILLNAYYLQKKFDDIREFPVTDIAAYDMYRAFVALEDDSERDDKKARKHLVIYFDKCALRKFNLEISDMPNNKFKAYECLIDILRNEDEVGEVQKYLRMLIAFYKSVFFVDELTEPDNLNERSHYKFIKDIQRWIEEKT